MSECFSPEVRDYLPDLVHGRLGEVDTATMLAHVEACDACAAEVAILREVRESAPIAPRIDVNALVALLPAPRVPASVGTPRAPRVSRVWQFASVAVVAIVALFLGTQSPTDREPAQTARISESPVVVQAVKPSAVTDEGEASVALVASVSDLSDDEIELLLAELDDIETIPSAEPEAAQVGPTEETGA